MHFWPYSLMVKNENLNLELFLGFVFEHNKMTHRIGTLYKHLTEKFLILKRIFQILNHEYPDSLKRKTKNTEALTSSTFLEIASLQKMRSSRWDLIQYDWCHRRKMTWRDTGKCHVRREEWDKAPINQGTPKTACKL